jgi:hypothetical protein
MLITGGETGKKVFWMNDCPQNREICPAAFAFRNYDFRNKSEAKY